MAIRPLGFSDGGVTKLSSTDVKTSKQSSIWGSPQNNKQENPVYKEFNKLWDDYGEVMQRPMNENELLEKGFVKKPIGRDGNYFMYSNPKTREAVHVIEPQKPGDPISYSYHNRSVTNTMKFDNTGKFIGGEVLANGKIYTYQLDMEGKPFLTGCKLDTPNTRSIVH